MSLRKRVTTGALVALPGLTAATAARAQGRGGGGGAPGGGMGRGGPGGMGGSSPMGIPTFPNARPNAGPPPSRDRGGQSSVSPMHGGLQLGPPGRWWDDKEHSPFE
jgi:hypothetical protein